jgi:NADH:ubiquinone oxidoreductase subunit 3 (subunit A)
MLFFIPIKYSFDLFLPSFYYDFYIVLLCLFLILLTIAFVIFVFIYLLNKRFWLSSQTQTVYECGFLPFEEARVRFEPKFYMVALSFIIFDLEICFIFPWLLVFHFMGFIFLFFFIVFLLLVLFGIIYEYKNGIFDWN